LRRWWKGAINENRPGNEQLGEILVKQGMLILEQKESNKEEIEKLNEEIKKKDKKIKDISDDLIKIKGENVKLDDKKKEEKRIKWREQYKQRKVNNEIDKKLQKF